MQPNNGEPKSIDRGGRILFVVLLLLIPVTTVVSLIFLTNVINEQPDSSIISVTTTSGQDGGTLTTTRYLTPTASLGVFDPALGKVRGFAIGPLIVLIGGILEAALLLVYGTFYVSYGASAMKTSLGLPPGAVRAFVLIIVILAIVSFALLPADWGDNKAVTFLLGLFSTIIGFYFGSRKDEEDRARSGGNTP